MLQSNPEATPAELAEAITTTAEHRGDPGKNNVYGTGLVQAFAAVTAVESDVAFYAHAIDDVEAGNGDLSLDPGERVVMQITMENRTATPIDGLEVVLSTETPGVSIHEHHATYPTLPAQGTVVSDPPHYSVTLDPSLCSAVAVFDLEMTYGGETRRSTFYARIGEEHIGPMLDDDFDSDLGWTSDPGSTTTGAFVREDPIGVQDDLSRFSNPEDDSSPDGTRCWVTGNGVIGGKNDENNNDVDDGAAALLSPPFGEPILYALDLSYDRWYYDVDSGNSFRSEVSNDGGATWTVLEDRPWGDGGWETFTVDLLTVLPPTDDMRLRFVITDSGTDDPVEGAIDEVVISGRWVECETYTPPSAMAPNPVGETLRVSADPSGHAVLTWDPPPADASHDPATLYRVERATSPAGPYDEVGSATVTGWVDVDALTEPGSYYYRVRAENAGGTE